jgi:hypothetical protein
MLFNPKWTKKTTPTIFGFVKFLEKQPSDGCYLWMFSEDCVIGRYLATVGVRYKGAVLSPLYLGWENLIAQPLPHTYGAALKRARKVLAHHQRSGAEHYR